MTFNESFPVGKFGIMSSGLAGSTIKASVGEYFTRYEKLSLMIGRICTVGVKRGTPCRLDMVLERREVEVRNRSGEDKAKARRLNSIKRSG